MGNPVSANLSNGMVAIVNEEFLLNMSYKPSLVNYEEKLTSGQNLLLIYHFIENGID